MFQDSQFLSKTEHQEKRKAFYIVQTFNSKIAKACKVHDIHGHFKYKYKCFLSL